MFGCQLGYGAKDKGAALDPEGFGLDPVSAF